jgi:hypothetical protein
LVNGEEGMKIYFHSQKSKIFKAFDILLKYDQKLQYILIVSKNEN